MEHRFDVELQWKKQNGWNNKFTQITQNLNILENLL